MNSIFDHLINIISAIQTAIAVVDMEMIYTDVSQQKVDDFNLNGKRIIVDFITSSLRS